MADPRREKTGFKSKLAFWGEGIVNFFCSQRYDEFAICSVIFLSKPIFLRLAICGVQEKWLQCSQGENAAMETATVQSCRSDSWYKTRAKGKLRLNTKVLSSLRLSTCLSSNNSFLLDVLNQIFGWTTASSDRTNSVYETLHFFHSYWTEWSTVHKVIAD